MPGTPEDVRLKLAHARRHPQTLNAQFASFGDRNPYTTVGELHLRTKYEGDIVVRMMVNRDPLQEWSVTIGDCAHNLRATLDYIALALWEAHSGPPMRRQLKRIQFPIYSRQGDFRDNRHDRIGGLHPNAKSIIRRAQPYQRRNDPDGHPLAILAEINNQDKHRLLHITHAIVQDARIEIDAHDIEITEQPTPRSGRFKDGDVVARIGARVCGDDPKMHVELHETYGIAFDEQGPGRGEPVADLLHNIRVYIRDTLLVALEPYF
jgi:hypothetical protein